jgi:hypothetical protein
MLSKISSEIASALSNILKTRCWNAFWRESSKIRRNDSGEPQKDPPGAAVLHCHGFVKKAEIHHASIGRELQRQSLRQFSGLLVRRMFSHAARNPLICLLLAKDCLF